MFTQVQCVIKRSFVCLLNISWWHKGQDFYTPMCPWEIHLKPRRFLRPQANSWWTEVQHKQKSKRFASCFYSFFQETHCKSGCKYWNPVKLCLYNFYNSLLQYYLPYILFWVVFSPKKDKYIDCCRGFLLPNTAWHVLSLIGLLKGIVGYVGLDLWF